MNLLNHVIVGLLVLSSVTLTACQKEVPKTEEIPYVMVTQPNTNHIDQKSYAGDVQAKQQSVTSSAGPASARASSITGPRPTHPLSTSSSTFSPPA